MKMSNDSSKWKVGSKLVRSDIPYHPYYWRVDDINYKEGTIELTAYCSETDGNRGPCGQFYIEELCDVKLAESKVKPTKLAKKIYPNAKEEDGWLIIEN